MPTPRNALAGRGHELARVDEALDAGERALFLVGEAGIGKTTLVGEVVARARERGYRVLTGHCLPLDGIAFDGLSEAIEHLDDDDLAGLPDPVLAGLRPVLPTRELPDPPLGQATFEEGQARVLGSVRETLAHVSRKRPVLLVLEDLHWAHPSTSDVALALCRRLSRSGSVLVGTVRSPEDSWAARLAELHRLPDVDVLELQGLDDSDVSKQLSALMGHVPPRVFVERVQRRARGNPLFVAELAANGVEAPMPQHLRDLFRRTVADLPERTTGLLRVCAAAGRDVHHRLLAECAGVGPEEVAAALRPALEREVLRADGERYRFRHPLLAETTAETMLPGERQAVHGRLARALAKQPDLGSGSPASEVALHHAEADEPELFLATLDSALVEVERVLAMDVALTHLERALTVWDRVPSAEQITGRTRGDLLSRAAQAAWQSGRSRRATELVRLALAEDDGTDPIRTGLLLDALSRLVGSNFHPTAEARETALRAAALIPGHPASAARAQVLATVAALHWEHHPEIAITYGREALEVALAVGEVEQECRARIALGSALTARGDVEEGCEQVRAARSTALDHGLLWEVARSYGLHSAVLIKAGRAGQGAADALAGLAWIREHGLSSAYGAYLAGNASSGLFLTGRWEEALGLLSESEGDDGSRGWLHLLAARTLAFMGRGEQARASLATAEEYAAGLDPHFPNVSAWVALLGDDPDRALTLVRTALDSPEPAHAGTINERVLLGLLALDGIDGQGVPCAPAHGSGDVVEELLGHLVDGDSVGGIGHAVGWSLTVRAESARWRGGSALEVDAAWRAALAAWDALEGWVHVRSLVRCRLAMVCADLEEARRLLDTVVDVASPWLQVQADRAAQARGLAPDLAVVDDTGVGRAGQPEVVPLTAREEEVLGLLVEGRSNRQIGRRLGITEKTASVHVSNLLRKIGASSRTEAATWALREGRISLRSS